jgi:hypothetical protein
MEPGTGQTGHTPLCPELPRLELQHRLKVGLYPALPMLIMGARRDRERRSTAITTILLHHLRLAVALTRIHLHKAAVISHHFRPPRRVVGRRPLARLPATGIPTIQSMPRQDGVTLMLLRPTAILRVLNLDRPGFPQLTDIPVRRQHMDIQQTDITNRPSTHRARPQIQSNVYGRTYHDETTCHHPLRTADKRMARDPLRRCKITLPEPPSSPTKHAVLQYLRRHVPL